MCVKVLIWEIPCRLAARSAALRKATCGPDQDTDHPFKVAARRARTPVGALCPTGRLGVGVAMTELCDGVSRPLASLPRPLLR
jgi:hypothetical protein